MDNLITLVVIVLLIIAVFIYLEREAKRRDRVEKERFREFVLAIKSEKVEDYVQVLPADDTPLPQQQEDELVDLDQVDPEQLLKAIKHEDN